MNRSLVLLILTLALLALAGCSAAATPTAPPVTPQPEIMTLDGPLSLSAFAADRQVTPGSDQVYEFMLANATEQAVPVQVALAHQAGQRWRTSLCLELQCILGDGTEPSVTETFLLPAYFELPFQVHLFVDEAAQVGQQAQLELRLEPQAGDIPRQRMTLNAAVIAP